MGIVGVALPLLVPSVGSIMSMTVASVAAPFVAPGFLIFSFAAIMFWLNPEAVKRAVKFVLRHWRFFSILLLLLIVTYVCVSIVYY